MEEKKVSLEDRFTILEDTLKKLEGEEVSLEEAFSLYESGMKLVASCEEEIDLVEKKVLAISGGETVEFS